ncbi:MAG: HIT domain-containing protein, partial [Sulfitobacter sp.]
EGLALPVGEGFRMIANAGAHGVQDVPHLHVHILGGRPMGRMVSQQA